MLMANLGSAMVLLVVRSPLGQNPVIEVRIFERLVACFFFLMAIGSVPGSPQPQPVPDSLRISFANNRLLDQAVEVLTGDGSLIDLAKEAGESLVQNICFGVNHVDILQLTSPVAPVIFLVEDNNGNRRSQTT